MPNMLTVDQRFRMQLLRTILLMKIMSNLHSKKANAEDTGESTV